MNYVLFMNVIQKILWNHGRERREHKSDQNDFTCPERWFIYTYSEATMRKVVDELFCKGRLSYQGLNGK